MLGGDSILIEKRITNRAQLSGLLDSFSLKDIENADYTVGIFNNQKLLGFGSLKGDIIAGVIVDREAQNEGISAKIISHLIKIAISSGFDTIYLFTLPGKAYFFSNLGFRLVAKAPPFAAMLEWGDHSLSKYIEYLSTLSFEGNPEAVAIVMNANPFTNGHKYLVEKAAAENDYLYIIIVEEDCSLFSFEDRMELVQIGTAHLPNVRVVSGGRYCVSALTFPSYFTQEQRLAEAHASIDLTLFATHIAQTLNIKKRYIGTEANSEVTNTYNEVMKKLLPSQGIQVEEVPRITVCGDAVSASRVRHIMSQAKASASENFSQKPNEQKLSKLHALVPSTTYTYFVSNWERLINQSEESFQRRLSNEN